VTQTLRSIQYDNRALMAEVIAGLLQGRTVEDVCDTLGINRNRVTKWYREDPEFLELLEGTTDAIVDAIKADVVAETASRMSELLPKAVSVLEEAMSSEKTSERVTAAAHVMRFSGLGAKKEAPKPSVAPEELIRGARGPATGD
jgi:hypothetical protein